MTTPDDGEDPAVTAYRAVRDGDGGARVREILRESFTTYEELVRVEMAATALNWACRDIRHERRQEH